VCKHGNRAASSRCGAADLLEELGVVLDLGPTGVARCVAEAGIGFCYAPRFHPALRHAGPARRELGVPTAFNVLGPLANPARVVRQVVGVADPTVAERMLRVLADHGADHVVVVHGTDGLDELTTTGPSTMYELRGGEITVATVDPTDLGFAVVGPERLQGGSPADSAAFARNVLGGQRGPHRDIVVLNAAAALLVAGEVDDLRSGVEAAATSIDDGRAAKVLDTFVRVSQEAAEDSAR
jgi:anthranilate phosphoribosyltransferase